MKSIIYVVISLCVLCSCDAGIHPLSKSNLEESKTTLIQEQSDKNTVSSDYETLQIDFYGNETADTVKNSLGLPTMGSFGSTIEWTSSKPDSINPANGTVVQPRSIHGNQAVILTAHIQKGNASRKKNFNITVLKKSYSDDDD